MSSAGRIGRPRLRPRATPSGDPSDDILAAASRLFGERGVTATTMAQIATGAGLQQSSLYYYFRSKEEILAALVAKANVVPLELVRRDSPALPGPGWHRVRTRLAGICGSDLSMIEGHASTYFDDWVSFPFVPGHEVVGELDDGTRVVLEPVLGHEARGFRPPFPGAAPGDGRRGRAAGARR